MRVTRTVPLLASTTIAALALGVSSAGAAPFKNPKARADTLVAAPLIKVVGGEEVAMTLAGAKRYTRGELRVACTNVPDDLGNNITGSETTTTTLRRGLRLPFSRRFDYCIASLERTTKGGSSLVSLGSVAITEVGDDYLYERGVAGVMSLASTLTFSSGEDEARTVPQIIDQLKKALVRGRKLTPVALPAPRTKVSFDQLGIWTDGTSTSITAKTPGGRDLYFDYDRSTRDLSSNIVPALIDDFGFDD